MDFFGLSAISGGRRSGFGIMAHHVLPFMGLRLLDNGPGFLFFLDKEQPVCQCFNYGNFLSRTLDIGTRPKMESVHLGKRGREGRE